MEPASPQSEQQKQRCAARDRENLHDAGLFRMLRFE
jgi:hypothetical protein